jgi:hypothetical protein
MLGGPIPVRILRAAQFHEFVAQLIDWGRQGQVSYVQQGRTQLVAARSVAEALADLATDPEWAITPGSVAAPIPEIAGPREESLVEMAKLLVARRGETLRIEARPAPPPVGRLPVGSAARRDAADRGGERHSRPRPRAV